MHHLENESHSTFQREFGTTQDYLYPIWLTFNVFYLSVLFETLRYPFPNSHFSTHAISYSVLCSISHSVNLFLSVSLSPSPAYPPLCFYLLPFYIKGNQFVWPASLNKVNWTNVAPHLGFAHNNITVELGSTRTLALLKKIRLGWKWQPHTITVESSTKIGCRVSP